VRVVRAAFPRLNDWLNGLPDPRVQEMCLYSAAHLWWQVLATYLCRKGSRHGFDQQRQSGQAPWNMGVLCGQPPEDPRFGASPPSPARIMPPITPAAWTRSGWRVCRCSCSGNCTSAVSSTGPGFWTAGIS
jgi:hypothetical protein